ncbi:hypothetical protein H4P12_08510 [Paracoccus sp. 11-3]|uniref:Uncharacterized protein n=1 Tax=Paracoccus amoyensis TaxID=2760093 RepID=A0A926G944_9RHOB|nr:hypothetical protein [Paracoccus amoyensis]MBC9246753.1 hypothetical protein [Paracoccus amoyensis]
MTLPTSYKTGRVSVTAGSTTVAGASTLWLAAGLNPGDVFWAAGLSVSIQSIDGNGKITLAYPWPGATLVSILYEIRFASDASRVLAASREVLRRLADGEFISFDGISVATGGENSAVSYANGLLTIPRGKRGAVNFSELTVRTGNPGSNVSIANNILTIPRGADGDVSAAQLTVETNRRIAGLRDAGALPLVSVAGTADAITANLAASLVEGGIVVGASSMVELIPVAANTGPATLQVGTDSVRTIVTETGAQLGAGALRTGVSYILRRRGSTWRIISGLVLAGDLTAERTERNLNNALAGMVMLENIAGSGDAITADMPSLLIGTGIAASNLRNIRFTVPAENGGTPTINIGGTGAVQIFDTRNVALPAGTLKPGQVYDATKIAGRWRLLSPEVSRADHQAEVTARQAGESALNSRVDTVTQRNLHTGAAVGQLQQQQDFAGDDVILAHDRSGNVVGWFDDRGRLVLGGLLTGDYRAGDDAAIIAADQSGRPVIWVTMDGKFGSAPIDWTRQPLTGFDWGAVFAGGFAGDPLVVMGDASGRALIWVDEAGQLFGGGGGGGGISRRQPATSGNAWQPIDDGTSLRYLSDQYQGRIMGFEERAGLNLAETGPNAVGVIAYGGGGALVTRPVPEDWRYHIRRPDLGHDGGMLSAEAIAAMMLTDRRARNLSLPTVIAMTAGLGSPTASETNAASPLYSTVLGQIAQSVLKLAEWDKALIVDRVAMSLLAGAPQTSEIAADNEYASTAAALRADIVLATGQSQPPLIVVSPSAGTRGGDASAVALAESKLDAAHPALGLVVAGPRHVYALQEGTLATLTAEGAMMQSELEAIAVREIHAGRLWYCPRLSSATIRDATITAYFLSMSDLMIPAAGEHGLSITGITNGVTVTNVALAGRIATITLSGNPTGDLKLNCAWGRTGNPTGARPFNRSDIRDDFWEPSRILPHHVHFRQALPASVSVTAA